MNRISIISSVFTIVVIALLLFQSACRKTLADTEASAVVDRIALHYGNDRIYNGFTLRNTGQKNLTYQLDEQIDWLTVANPSGELPGRSQTEITCSVSRSQLPKGNYTGQIQLRTSAADFTLNVFMNVDMYLVTFINPAFSTIHLRIDTVLNSADTNLFSRSIGKNDSVQFGFSSPPEIVTYAAQTSGRYTDSTQLGLLMQWKGHRFLNGKEVPRLFLDVSKAYFHLSIINNNQVLNPLYVNAGNQFQTVENIFIYQSTEPLPIGYYHALNNTVIRAIIAGQTNSITWSNNNQFELPFTANQSVVIDTYSNDTTKSVSFSPRNFNPEKQKISTANGNVIHILSSN